MDQVSGDLGPSARLIRIFIVNISQIMSFGTKKNPIESTPTILIRTISSFALSRNRVITGASAAPQA